MSGRILKDCRLNKGNLLGEVLTKSTRSFKVIMNHIRVGEGGIGDWGNYLCC